MASITSQPLLVQCVLSEFRSSFIPSILSSLGVSHDDTVANLEAVEIHKCSDERFPKDLELAQRVPEDIEPPDGADIQFQQPGQEVVGNVGLSVLLHSPRPAAALTQHTPCLC
jgi:hypothetical protein